MKTTAERRADPSVIGLTGAAKKAAIKKLYDTEKALLPQAEIQEPQESKKILSAEEIVALVKQHHDPRPALWAPGVTYLGWSFFVEDGKLIINRYLNQDYVAKICSEFPKFLPNVQVFAGNHT